MVEKDELYKLKLMQEGAMPMNLPRVIIVEEDDSGEVAQLLSFEDLREIARGEVGIVLRGRRVGGLYAE